MADHFDKRGSVVKRALTLAIVVVFSCVPPSPLAAETQQRCDVGGRIGDRIPVLLVHGWTGDPQIWTEPSGSLQQRLDRDPHLYPLVFDYSDANLEWVTDPRIGSALADCISDLSAKSEDAGGVGRVVVVTHSMGGLAVREAGSKVRDGHSVGEDIGLVINLGTPHLGSWLAGHHLGRLGAPRRLLLKLLAALCVPGAVQARSAEAACRLIQNRRSPAAIAMEIGSPELRVLPEPPPALPVLNIAGDIELRTSIFGRGLTIGPVGDGVVFEGSAKAFASNRRLGGGTFKVECDVNVAHLAFGAYGMSRVERGLRRCLEVAYHSSLPRNSSLHQRIADAAGSYGLMNQRLPKSACAPRVPAHVSRVLSEGASGSSGNSIRLTHAVRGDLDGDAVVDGVVTVSCVGGNGGFTQAYARLTSIPGLLLVPLTQYPHASTNRAFSAPDSVEWVHAAMIEDQTLILRTTTWEDWDAHAGGTQDAIQYFRLDDGNLVLHAARLVSAPSSTLELVKAINAGDRRAASDLASPRVVSRLVNLRGDFGPLDQRWPGCFTITYPSRHAGGTGCFVSAGGWTAEIAWERHGFGAWQAVGYADIGGGQ